MARIHGTVDEAMIKRLTEGVLLEDGVARFQSVKAQHARGEHDEGGSNRWFRVILAEGRTREVRRLWESQDVEVNRLKRISYGPIDLPSIVRSSDFIELDPKQVISLFHAVNLRAPRISEKSVVREMRERKEKKLRARGNTYK